MMNEEVWTLVVFALLNGNKADRQKAWEQLCIHNMEVNDQNRRELVAEMQERHENEMREVRELQAHTIRMLQQDYDSAKQTVARVREAWAQNGLLNKLAEFVCGDYQSKKAAEAVYISQIKQLREVTGMGLRETKETIDRCYAAREAKNEKVRI